MNAWTQIGAPMLAAFLASLVECVEALTVVLAIASLRGWRSALWGVAAALVGLCCIGLLGHSLSDLPVALAQRLIGGLLLLFGLRWLRKAILRSAGVIALHDESAAFDKAQKRLRGEAYAAEHGLDPIAFWGSFKIVLLEGLEVIFIIIAVATKEGSLWPACVGALAALVLVIALGALLRRPLASIPENSLKFAVGLLLVALGSFWLGEGLSLEWPGGDWSVLGLLAFYTLLALGLVRVCAGLSAKRHAASAAKPLSGTGLPTSSLRAALEELIGLFIDDRWLAFAAIAWIVVCALAQKSGALERVSGAGGILFAGGLGCLLAVATLRAAAIEPNP